MVGCSGAQINLSVQSVVVLKLHYYPTWAVIPRIFPLGWMLELWVGAILATLVAGRIYRDREG
jgi:hypothetical protein